MEKMTMTDSTIAFIGLGLIGGSIARAIRKTRPDIRIMAYMRSRSRLEQARKEGIVDVILDGIDENLRECDLIFLCTPVEYNAGYLSAIRPYLKQGALITDVGSTKSGIHEEIRRQGLEYCFVGGHPMAGSEKTGYENSTDHLLENAYYIVTPPEGKNSSRPQDLSSNAERIVAVAKTIGAIPLVLDYREHDKVVAAISHLPHLVASSLVNLIKDHDTADGTMKQVAAGGFKDITRIASASPVMWEQICMTNETNIASLLRDYIESLNRILTVLDSRDSDSVRELFESSRDYRNSFETRVSGPIAPDYSFSVDVCDEPGAISIISAILAGKGISIKNIGINHNRENGEGALSINFYDEKSRNAAWERLKKYNYTLFNF